jgi:hypothetical protein
VVGSTVTCVTHEHVGIIGQWIGEGTSGQIGHLWMGQQVCGSAPEDTGGQPPGQTTWDIGHAMGGLVGSQAGRAGTHREVHVWPPHVPAASQAQVESPTGQEQAVAGPLPFAQPQPTHVVPQCWSLGQSASTVQFPC